MNTETPMLICNCKKTVESWLVRLNVAFGGTYSEIVFNENLNMFGFQINERHIEQIKKIIPEINFTFHFSRIQKSNKNWFKN